jgi:ribosomal protein S18 acetylase RimI-like enzyme
MSDAAAVTAVRLRDEDLAAAGDAVARAFAEDPVAAFLYPRREGREARVLTSFLPVIRYGLKHGEVYTTAADPRGVAVWLPPPGRSAVSARGLVEAGMVEGMLNGGLGSIFRAMLCSYEMQRLDTDLNRRQNWYLWLLGVAPEWQSQGIASELLAPVLEKADRTRIPCCLETATERAVSFYRRHGFEVTAKGRVPFGGPHVWTMTRRARTAQSSDSESRDTIRQSSPADPETPEP